MFHIKKYRKGDTVIREGSHGDSLFYIVDGTVAVRINDRSDNKDLIVSYLSNGQFFGEMGLFIKGERTAEVVAKAECRLAEISYGRFKELYSDDPEVLLSVTRQMAQRLRDTTSKAADLSFVDVTGRIAKTLNDLTKQPEAMTHPDGMQIKVTRIELAKIVGCSREMVGRIIKQFEASGIIRVEGTKTMVILR
jgi:CRP/FNR family cyclic AMP-dependent transcriptional regulator